MGYSGGNLAGGQSEENPRFVEIEEEDEVDENGAILVRRHAKRNQE